MTGAARSEERLKPESVAALERAGTFTEMHVHDRGDETAGATPVPQFGDGAHPGKELAEPSRAKPGQESATADEGHRKAAAQLLGDVSAVGERDEQEAYAPVPAHLKTSHIEAPNNLAGQAHANADPQPHPDSEAAADHRPCREEQQHLVITGLGPASCPGAERDESS